MEVYVASHLKDMNRRKVYNLLCELGETSKSEISRLTGISPPTVIKIINFMIEKGFLEELGGGEAPLGRKPQMLRIKKNRYYSIGVIHEGDYLKVGLCNWMNEIAGVKTVRIAGDFQTTMGDTLFALINEVLIEYNVQLSDVLGIGIGVPAIYDVERKVINTAPLIGIQEKTDISAILERIEQKYRIPVFVDNDLNMEVQGEFISRKLGTENDLIYLSIGTGIGSGVILGGSLRRGRRYMCGEVGYMTFIDDYVANEATAGWLESKINLQSITEKFGEAGKMEGGSQETAIEYVSICAALCINNMMLCYDCDNFSIGGEMFKLLGNRLFNAIVEKLERISVAETDIRMKSCEEPGIIGASSVSTNSALKRILEN